MSAGNPKRQADVNSSEQNFDEYNQNYIIHTSDFRDCE